MFALRVYVAVIGIFLPCVAFADTLASSLPFDLNDGNTKVTFTIDSTWHEVHGSTKNITGRVWLADTQVLSSLRAEIAFPVASFDTENSSRDERMREVLVAEKYQKVRVQIQGVSGLPQGLDWSLANDAVLPIKLSLHAVVRIKNVEKNLDIVAELRKEQQGYSVTGTTLLRWDEFGVEDPSILIAHLDKEMSIHFHVNIP